MISNLLTVFWQVVILFLLMSFGFAGGKTGLINENGSKVMTNVSLYFVTPCLIINSFNIEYDPAKLKGLLICLVSAILIHAFTIFLVTLLFKSNEKKRNRVLRFACVFSNAAYMGIPLQQAVLGSEGVFYGSVYIAVFNITLWTYGVVCSTDDIKNISGKKILANPGIIGVILGFVLFLLPIKLPTVLSSVISNMANLNTPLAMLIIGFYLTQSNIITALKDKSVYLVAFIRLIAVPLITMGVLYVCGIRDTILVSLITASSAPVAAATSMFATRFDNDITLSVNLVTFTTVLSVLTMPVIVALAQFIS